MEQRERIDRANRGDGSLPGRSAPMAFPYVPVQNSVQGAYNQATALSSGTLFPGLDLPFKAAMQSRMPDVQPEMVELMALDFALQELKLYLDTHSWDREAMQLLNEYQQLAKEGRLRYEKRYGPVSFAAVSGNGYRWLEDPWPWDREKGGEN